MKKSLFLSLAFTVYYIIVCTGNATAQVTVIVTPEGKIVSMYGTNKSPILYQSGNSPGFRRLGNIDVHYLPGTQEPDRLGNVVIGYESVPALKGKINRIGDLHFYYHTSGATPGKLMRVSARRVMYDLTGRMTISMRFLEQGGNVEIILAPRL